ncbi:peptidase M32 [Sulfolobus acidocaldarius SUSAZ]|nr:peptidase M32 [Sulfolobus acidocaldarius SUSAZ]
MKRFENLKELLAEYKKLWSIQYAESLMGWDIETYMPEDDAMIRGEVISTFSEIKREIYQKLGKIIERYEGKEGLNDEERGILRVLGRDYKYYSKIPLEIIQQIERVRSEATVVWRQAKAKSDYSMFKPYLEKIKDLQIKIAEYWGYEDHPYNALLDLNEEGFSIRDGDRIFSRLLPELSDIMKKVSEKGYFPKSHELEEVSYDIGRMKVVNEEVIKILEMPGRKFRLDISAHPFTVRISADDVRITTRYEGKDFRSTLFSVVHECGHAIYELGIDRELEGTPIGGGVSMGIHEAQSRFWENIIGRSRDFVSLIYPKLKQNLDFISKYEEDDIYRYFNIVRPSFIRVDADEVTYNFHIAVRYEIEKMLIGGEIKVDEIPSLWNELMEKYLGIKPKNDAEGVLQDIHWTSGFGYFPAYTLGNVVSGIVYSKTANLYNLLREGKIGEMKAIMTDKIYKYGATYSPKDLLRKSFGEEYNPEGLIQYLRHKYLKS